MSNETHDKYEICAAWLKGKDARSGMVENPVKEYTNRSIQRKINEALKENKSVMLSYCISAVILRNGETFKQLDFKEKYHRTLVESLKVSTQPDDQKSWNKQHQKS